MSKTNTLDAVEELNKVLQSKPDLETRVTRNLQVGQGIHQGDVYIHRVKNSHKRGKALGTRQVAVGDTIGSRHIAEGPVTVFAGQELPASCTFTDKRIRQAITGPVIVADAEWTLTHPEHAHHTLPAGTYQVTYQLDQQTMRAVQD